MFSLPLVALALQINRVFPIEDVQHLIDARAPPPQVTFVRGDLVGYRALVVPTRIPDTATVSMEASRLHLHDPETFRRCVWDGAVSYDEKKEIVAHMLQWRIATNQTELDHHLCDHEDGSVFADVMDAL